MLNITPYGYSAFTGAATSVPKQVHLHTESGELTGHGYAPIPLDSEQWDEGRYPDLQWEFEAGDTVWVLGYYVTDINGKIIYSEEFTQRTPEGDMVGSPMKIQHNGDRITVALNLNLLRSGR